MEACVNILSRFGGIVLETLSLPFFEESFVRSGFTYESFDLSKELALVSLAVTAIF